MKIKKVFENNQYYEKLDKSLNSQILYLGTKFECLSEKEIDEISKKFPQFTKWSGNLRFQYGMGKDRIVFEVYVDREEEWYYIKMYKLAFTIKIWELVSIYKCDQFDGLIKCIFDKFLKFKF